MQPEGFSILFAVFLLHLSLHIRHSSAGASTNKLRYATSKSVHQLEDTVESAASMGMLQDIIMPEKYRYKASSIRGRHEATKLLDQVDARYRETQSNSPSTLLQTHSKLKNLLLENHPGIRKEEIYPKVPVTSFQNTGGWSYDTEEAFKTSLTAQNKASESKYAPQMKILTSYNPIDEPRLYGLLDVGRDKKVYSPNGYNKKDKKTEATVYYMKDGQPDINATSTVNAIRLHDSMLLEPPRDGKVRVRMYHHRAIHDDKRLYGTGPWKYWGQGWGLELGYDPKSLKKDKDFYERGYSIERAFGRDFCLDKRKCRQADPNFFKTGSDAGKYSKQVSDSQMLKEPKVSSR